MSTSPVVLYHGSRFKQTELKPGFLHSGVLVEWDETESNHFLYATTILTTAWELGFASSLEKIFNIERFHVHEGNILIQTPDDLSEKDLYSLEVYLYTIDNRSEDGWCKNENDHNGLDTEYKTKSTVHAIKSCEQLDVCKWLCNYSVQIERVLPDIQVGKSKELVMESLLPVYTKW